MTKEIYEKPQGKLVVFDCNEVYMLSLWSKSDGEDRPFPSEEDDWDVYSD